MRLLPRWALLLLLAACQPASVTSAGPASAPAPAESCEGLAARFEALAASAPAACSRDADCACHPDLRVDGRLLVADRARAKSLTQLADRYRSRHCPTVFESSAVPPRCEARCAENRCR